MSTSKTSATRKVAAGVVSFAMALSFVFGGSVSSVQAQTAAELQAQVASLQAMIAALTAQLGALSGTPAPTAGTGYVFTRNLKQGDTGADVKELQKFLNRDAATMVAASGVGSAGNESMTFGPATKAAVIKFQNKYAASTLAPAGLTAGTGFFGALSRAKANEMNAGSTPTNPNPTYPTGSTLNVTLASNSAAASALVMGQAIANLASFTFTNTSGAEAKVTKVVLNRTGISADSTLSNVYLFDGATRVSDAATVSLGKIALNNASGLFTVPAGSSKTISVRSDIANNTSGQLVGVALASVESTATVSGMFPISGANHSVASATMGTVTLSYLGPDGANENPGSEVRVFEASAIVSQNAARLEALTFENRGTSSDGDITNLRLYVDGAVVGSPVAQFTNELATFDLSANPVRLETGTRIIKVMGDIVKGSSETYDIQLRRAADVRFVDVEFNQPILATSFPVSGTANTIASGSLSVVKANTSPSTNVTVGSTNSLWSSFDFRAAGEDIKIEAAQITVGSTGGIEGGMDNVKVFVNGSQVGSTKDVAESTATEFTFGSSFIAKAGVITKVDIYGDAKTTTGTDFTSGSIVTAGIAITGSDTEGLSSGDAVTTISIVNGTQRTMASSSLSASKSAYANETMIAGTNNARIGSFVLSAGSTEGINVNTIVVNLSANNAASLTDLLLKDTSGNQIGSIKSSPSTSNSFSVNLAIPASGSKTIDVYGNIKSGSNDGSVVATLDYTTGGTGAVTANTARLGTSDSSNLALQTITVGSGTLTVTVDSNTPNDSIVIAGTSEAVKVGSFNFLAKYSAYTVQELVVKIPVNAASSVGSVTLKTGSTVIRGGNALISVDGMSYATSTFTGLSFEVPQSSGIDGKVLDVYVTVPALQDTVSTGKNISVLLADYGFKAINAAGTTDEDLAAADLNSAASTGKGTLTVRKSVPALSKVDVGSTLGGGTQTIAKVKISADAAGKVGWRKIVFAVTKSSGLTLGATTTLAIKDSAGQAVAGTFATTTGSLLGGLDSLSGLTTGNLIFVADEEEIITEGSSETYSLIASVGGFVSGKNYVQVKIDDTSTSSATAAFATIHGAVGDATESFVWSDRSALDHSAITTDWANDYKIKGLDEDLSDLSYTQA